MQNNIVHGDYKMKLTEKKDYKGLHFEIYEPDYNEIQQKEMDTYIITRLKKLLNNIE